MKFLSIVCFIALILAAFSKNTCQSNPIVPKLNSFVDKYAENLGDSAAEIKQVLQLLPLATPSSTKLDLCPNFSNVDSCCTTDLTDRFAGVIKAFFDANDSKQVKARALLTDLSKGINECAGEVALEEFFDSELNNLADAFLQCREDVELEIIKLINGTLCAVCAASEDYADVFDTTGDLQIIVDAVNWQEYDDALQATFTCFDNLNKDFAPLLTKRLAGDLLSSSQCSTLKTDIEKKIDDGYLQLSDACKDNVLSSECINESVVDTDRRIRRFLPSNDGFTTVNGKTGIKVYNKDTDTSALKSTKHVDYVGDAKQSTSYTGTEEEKYTKPVEETKIEDENKNGDNGDKNGDNNLDDKKGDETNDDKAKASSTILSVAMVATLALVALAL